MKPAIRRQREVLLVALGVLLLAAAPVAGAQNKRRSPTRHYLLMRDATSYADVSLPVAIDAARFDQLVDLLNLSEAQMAFAERLYDAFVSEYDEIAKARLPEFFEVSARAGASIETTGFTADYAEDSSRIGKLRNEFRAELKRMEFSFLAGLEPVLSTEQAGRLMRVRRDLERGYCASVKRWNLPAVAIELRPLVEGLDLREVDADATEQIGLILDAHEEFQTRAMCRYAATMEELDEVAWLQVERSQFQRAELPEAAAAEQKEAQAAVLVIQRRIEAIRTRILRAARQIRTANESRLEDIKVLLPPDTAEDLDRRYRMTAYPRVYRDDDELFEIYRKLSSMSDLPIDRDRLLELRDSYGLHYALLSKRMVAEFIRWCEFVPAGTISADDRYVHEERTNRLAEDRRRLSSDHRVLLRDLLGEEHAHLLDGTEPRGKLKGN